MLAGCARTLPRDGPFLTPSSNLNGWMGFNRTEAKLFGVHNSSGAALDFRRFPYVSVTRRADAAIRKTFGGFRLNAWLSLFSPLEMAAPVNRPSS